MRTPTFDSFDKETLIRFLGDVIEAEMNKPDDEINLGLIEECDGFLSELMSDVTVSDEQMQRNIAKIKGMAVPCEITSVRPRRMPRPRRIAAAILAAVLLIGGSLTAYAFVPAFRDMVRNVLHLDSGNSIDGDGVTYVYYGERKTYKNIEEWVNAQNLDILSLHDLPAHLQIKAIIGSDEPSGHMYNLSFTDGLSTIVICAGEIDGSALSDQAKKFVNSKNITAYILVRENVVVSTVVHNGWTYYLTTNTLDNMELILENLY